MNSLNLIGRLVKDNELKIVGEKGTKVINNTLAVVDKGNREKTNFINFTLFNKSAENFEKVASKGDLIALENAELKVDNYTNKDNEKRTNVYALAFVFQVLRKKNKENTTEERKVEENPFENAPNYEDEDLPF